MSLNYPGDNKNGKEESSSSAEATNWWHTFGQQVMFRLAQIMFIIFHLAANIVKVKDLK